MIKKAAGWLLVALMVVIYVGIICFAFGPFSTFSDNLMNWSFSLPGMIGFFVLFGGFLGLVAIVTFLILFVGNKLIKW